MTGYVVYDVFTDCRFGGNQLAVSPDAGALPDDLLQSIAAEFNFSEVVFVYPPDDLRHRAKLRIFTPTNEIPFADHPLIGSAIALADLESSADMILELGIGPVPCTVTNSGASFTARTPLTRRAMPDPALVARALGLSADDLDQSLHAPVHADAGITFVIANVRDRAVLSRCQPDLAAICEGARLHPAQLDFAILAYVRDGQAVQARMFAPLHNIPEDPATGSAAAALAALLQDETGAPVALTIHQGEDMGRASVIHAEADGDSVTISGTAVKVMEGQFLVR